MLIIETKIAISGGVPTFMSILPAGAVKQCFDLGIPCYLHTAGEDSGDGDTIFMTGYAHLDKIEHTVSDDGIMSVYDFTFGRTTLSAGSLDDPIGSYSGPIG